MARIRDTPSLGRAGGSVKTLYYANALLWLINSAMWMLYTHAPVMGVICGFACAGSAYVARTNDY